MAKKAAEAPKVLTDYIVLQAIELPKEATDKAGEKWRANRVAWLPVLNQTAEQGADGSPRIFSAGGGLAAIRMHTGKGADALEGTWKAVSLTSWRGGETIKHKTDSEHTPLDD